MMLGGLALLAAVLAIKFLVINRPAAQTPADCAYLAKPTAIALPAELAKVDRLKYSRRYARLFLLAGQTDGQWAVWSFAAGQWQSRLAIKGSDYKTAQARLHLDSQDNLYVEVSQPHGFYRSADGGQTWQTISHGDDGLLWALADNGRGELYATAWSLNRPLLYKSADQGLTWQTWLDFNKFLPGEDKRSDQTYPYNNLRHLHDVAAYQDKILVGTGDLARWTLMSADHGRSWRKVWNEGFTAHTFVKDTGQIILGGDRADRYGLALYDFGAAADATSTWDQSQVGWSSYIYSLIFQDGRYYAGVHNENGNRLKYGVLVSCDGRRWSPLLTYEPAADRDTAVFLAESDLNGFFLSLNGALSFVSRP